MIKVKSLTWYYIYTNGVQFCISEDAPVLSDIDKRWHHPELDYIITERPFFIGDPKASENIQNFME